MGEKWMLTKMDVNKNLGAGEQCLGPQKCSVRPWGQWLNGAFSGQ